MGGKESCMNGAYTNRLAEMRARWVLWSATTDTSSWEATFFFNVLDEKDRELAELRKAYAAALKDDQSL